MRTSRSSQTRFKAVRLLDAQAILACAAYVDLNPIRAAMAESLETSPHTSVQRRIEAAEATGSKAAKEIAAETTDTSTASVTPSPPSPKINSPKAGSSQPRPDQFLAPLPLNERTAALGPVPNSDQTRCSDKRFLPMSLVDYFQLLDWTGRQIARGKRGRIPNSVAPILQRLKLDRDGWCDLVGKFGKRFFHVAGEPTTVNATHSRVSQHRYYLPSQTRTLFTDQRPTPVATT